MRAMTIEEVCDLPPIEQAIRERVSCALMQAIDIFGVVSAEGTRIVSMEEFRDALNSRYDPSWVPASWRPPASGKQE